MKGARGLPQMNIKIPVEVKEMLVERAKKNLRSLNGEVLSRLIESLDRDTEQKNAVQ